MKAKTRTPKTLALGCAVVSIALLAWVPVSAEGDAASTFRRAREYTVRVRTLITEPFLEDVRGSFAGAGFLVDAARGWIVTNAHVVGQSPSDVQVAFADEPFQPARKVYVDSFTDVAVLRLDAPVPRRTAARLSCGVSPGVGEPVAVFGHPLGMPFTGSRGIVSGHTDQLGAVLLQIDATVDHGNSGGPVIALRDGEVVGIATAGAGGDKSDRVNFATPMQDVCRILSMLRQGTAPCPPVVEFDLLMDEDFRHTMRVGHTHDAARWPFQPGDRILRLTDGEALTSLSRLVSALRACSGPVPLVVEREGREVTVPVKPLLYPSITERRGISIDGALVAPHHFEDAATLREPPRLMVHSVEPGSRAEALRIEAQDMIWSVDGRRVADLDSLIALLQQRPSGTPVSIILARTSSQYRRIFDCHLRELPGEDIHVVGPPTDLALREER